ncbi:MAG: tRNA (adenosine(37)-N6)-threonylcarbamoyltransferase complex transferase subunit TsaD [Eubacteriales bacterium]|nr:tRNA (adenosine(37)-N6)-threonylcarbamoyltransferase complex transferase subunit TsaD [Eubacteriales bacterium]
MNMKILGIESSCDETAASVVSSQGGKLIIRSDIVSSQVEMHRLWGGVVPELAGRAHIECISRVTEAALDAAGISLRDLDAVAVTASPGLIGALLVGVNFAKALAVSNGIPLVPVEHVCAHITAAALLEEPPEPPFVAFAVSGGHTTIYDVQSWIDFRELGSTRDDAAGEAFDKVARVLGMPYPGGAAMDRLACEGNPGAVHFPSPAIADAGLDFSFSGLKTAALNAIHRARQTGTEICSADLAASFTAAVCEGIARRCREAIRLTGTRRVVVAGGVAANSHLRRALGEACAECGARLWIPPVALCGDNAAMVAASGYYHFLAGVRADERLNAFTD